ncbi:butyrophilin subfamily 1 member A1-like [Sparus aurata]|uniref:butyrophilin subfamily 1 member A1-like n=1 Tax=Sparus aurata TaxID=8175 RepID=UPI0011C0D1F7|nr:butyrophilin subfamily 1 member A1-like [Sparus aurata]
MDHVLNLHVLVLLLVRPPSPCVTGHVQVVGPAQPVVAAVGQDVVLPCHLEPAANASEMTVEWTRPDLEPRFVYVWRDGVELESKKHPVYKGRTSVFSDELKHGNISLKLSRVRISDEGRYRCFIPDVGDSSVQLIPGAVSSPFIVRIERSSSGHVVLQCDSTGWYPEPEVFWLDGEGNLLSAGPTETVRGPDDLYTVSSRVTVEKRRSNSFTCRVQQNSTNQTRETHIHVPDDILEAQHSSGHTAAQSPPQGVYLKAAAAKHRGLADTSVIDSGCGLAEGLR